jgi:ribonuclease HIII
MAQNTLVVALGADRARELEERLRAADFEFRSVEHARFSVRGEGVVATLYRSGKLVVQGSEVELFAQRFLGDLVTAPTNGVSVPGPGLERVRIGSDEVGKGDYFGPLVVVAVKLRPGEGPELERAGIMDSKRVSDEFARRAAPALEARYEHAIALLDPLEDNEVWAQSQNLNVLLADLHARALRSVAEPGADVLVDKFGPEALLRERLRGLAIDLRQTPRAEAEPAVAAASVIARGVFLERLAALSEEYAVDLAKGAGDPTDRAARRDVAIHPVHALGRAAKPHFTNTSRLGGRT